MENRLKKYVMGLNKQLAKEHSDGGVTKFFKRAIWFSYCIRALDLSKSSLKLIDYIQENTWSEYSGNYVTTNNYRLDIDAFLSPDCKKARFAIKELKERNLIIFNEDRSKMKINFDPSTWTLPENERNLVDMVKK